jgi:hypothetical protein
MKRLLLLFCCLLLLTSAVVAQQRTGNIYGTVVDDQRNPLPGVSVTLTGATIAPITTQTSDEGRFRFLSLFPGNDYVLKAELTGFKTKIETGVIVNVAKNSDIMVVMDAGALEEQVTVIAQTPIVDTKRTQITHTVNYEMLQALPSARDPWVILQLTPAIQLDRENVGGVEGGQQPYYQARGGTTQEWTVDGMQTTDMASISSPSYYDFDSFEEINISTGTMDVEHRDAGIVVNIVTRRGGNKLSLGGRFFYTGKNLQTKRPQTVLDANGLSGYNRAEDIKDFGFNAGGPLVKDKAWWWISYGIQEISTLNQINVFDKTWLNNYNGKLNLQLIPSNRFEFLFMLADKVKSGRSSSETYPAGWDQGSQFPWGNPTFKFQDEQMIGDSLFLSLRIGKSNPGFGLTPHDDLQIENLLYFDIANYVQRNTNTWFYSDRPHPYGVLQAQYFNDNILGTAHEIKIGFEYNNNRRIAVGGAPGNINAYIAAYGWYTGIGYNYNYPVLDWDDTGDVQTPPSDMYLVGIQRSTVVDADGTDRIAAYFNDTITMGRFNLNLGLRLDRAKDFLLAQSARSLWLESDDMTGLDPKYSNYAALASSLFEDDVIDSVRNDLMPDTERAYTAAQKIYTFLSPRVGLTYDLFGDGKTILKASYTLYPGGYPGVNFWAQYGLGGYMQFWWWDQNPDGIASKDELYWRDTSQDNLPIYHVYDEDGDFVGDDAREYGWEWWGFNWGSTELSETTDLIDTTTWKTNLTHEVTLSVEKEFVRNLGASLNFTWKKMNRFSRWLAYYPEAPGGGHLRSQSDYEVKGTVPNTLTGSGGATIDPRDAAGTQWWGLKPYSIEGNYTYPTPYQYSVNFPNSRYNTYWGLDFVVTKRLSNKWMANGSFTYQMQKQHIGDSYLEPTLNWANENQLYTFAQGAGSGKINANIFSRWMFKLMGLYQLPWDLTISGTVQGHEGAIVVTNFGVNNYSLDSTGGRTYTIPTVPYGQQDRLKPVYMFNLKLEKMLKLGDTAKMYFSVDCFNIFNNDVISRRYGVSLGTFRFTGTPQAAVQTGYNVPYGQSGVNNEMMNPRLFRLGMRFQF